jgi:hypothetical protein
MDCCFCLCCWMMETIHIDGRVWLYSIWTLVQHTVLCGVRLVVGMTDAIHGDIANVSTSWLLTSSQQTKHCNMGLEAQSFCTWQNE